MRPDMQGNCFRNHGRTTMESGYIELKYPVGNTQIGIYKEENKIGISYYFKGYLKVNMRAAHALSVYLSLLI